MRTSLRLFTSCRSAVHAGLLTSLSLLLGACSQEQPAQAASGSLLSAQSLPVWKLVYADEFGGASVDTSKWIVTQGAVSVNGELEYYAPDDVYLQGGNLVLRTQKRNLGGRAYTSGEVRSGNNVTVTRGSAVEWRTKVPKGKGIWPADWLVNTPCNGLIDCAAAWPPEIDVMEMRGSQPTVNNMTHWWGINPNQQYQTTQFTGPDFSQDFHTYRVEWLDSSITFYIDGVVRGSHTANLTSGTMQLIMNTAVGGIFDGNPDASTVFPVYQLIDYVRVYKDNRATLPTGGYKSLRVLTPGLENRYVRHANSLGYTGAVAASSDAGLKADATFKVVPGLADTSCVSFQARNFPGSYLRHASSRVRLDPFVDNPGFRADATFCAEVAPGGGVRFSASNFPAKYLRHAYSELWMSDGSGGNVWNEAAGFEQDTRWSVDAPWTP